MIEKQDPSYSFSSYIIGTGGLVAITWADINHWAGILVAVMSGLIVLGKFVHDYLIYGKKIIEWLKEFHPKK